MRTHFIKRQRLLLAIFLFLAAPTSSAQSIPALSVRQTGVPLYGQQDSEAEPIARLQKDEVLTPIAQSVGQETWYMVRTKQGQTGWVRAADVGISDQVKDAFKEKDSGSSSWAAVTAEGKTVGGTWSVAPNFTPRSASGFWTLKDPQGTTVLSGTWTAEMHSTGWNGTWRASVAGRQGDFSGSWSAEMPQPRKKGFTDLFETAVKEAIRGLWTGGIESGAWSIRTFK
jgi:hypothetical protein